MIGVTYSKSTGLWSARVHINKKRTTLYCGKSEKKAREVMTKHKEKISPTKKCLDCPAQITNKIQVLRCRPCAAKKKKKDNDKYNARKKRSENLLNGKVSDGIPWPATIST